MMTRSWLRRRPLFVCSTVGLLLIGGTALAPSRWAWGGGLSRVASATRAPAPAGIPGRWSLKFEDEFTGDRLNPDHWSKGWFGGGITPGPNRLEQDCYDPRQVSVGRGRLAITAIAKRETCGRPQPYASGLITSDGKYSFTYGVLEARIWAPGRGGRIVDWPAFWADGQNWPQDGEIDVLEGLHGRACWHFHYANGAPGGCATVHDAAAGWHTYAADWEPNRITYYYDGRRVGRVTTGVTSKPMYLIINLAVSGSASPPAIAPAKLRVAWVRVWQHRAAA
jgi:beta-glucanase (GH16 family)